jgi:MSHA biogenesis protein MshN
MSLINQMLKDLEARQQGGPSGQSVPVLRAKASSWRSMPLLIGGVSAVLLLAGLLFWSLAPEKTGVASPDSKQSAAASSDKKPAVAQVPSALQDGTGPPLSDTVSLNAIRLREIGSFIHFEADFDRPPVHHFTLAKDRRSLHIDLVAVRQSTELPPVMGRRWLAGLQTRQEETGLAVSLTLIPSVTIRDFSATMQVAGTGYRLLLDLYPETPAEALTQQEDQPAAVQETTKATVNQAIEGHNTSERIPQEMASTPPAGTVIQRAAEPSAKDLAEQAYRQGQLALVAGRSQEGAAALLQALELHPLHLTARQALVSELLRQQRQAEAGQILAEGLRLEPTQLSMRLRYAELLMAQGELENARDLLLQGPPQTPLAAPQLHALLGAIYQRLGQYRAAAQEYKGLLTTQPDNGLWQMGLGIAHEHAGAANEAVVAYRAALAGRDLSPVLNNYVRQRLTALLP